MYRVTWGGAIESGGNMLTLSGTYEHVDPLVCLVVVSTRVAELLDGVNLSKPGEPIRLLELSLGVDTWQE